MCYSGNCVGLSGLKIAPERLAPPNQGVDIPGMAKNLLANFCYWEVCESRDRPAAVTDGDEYRGVPRLFRRVFPQ